MKKGTFVTTKVWKGENFYCCFLVIFIEFYFASPAYKMYSLSHNYTCLCVIAFLGSNYPKTSYFVPLYKFNFHLAKLEDEIF